MNYYWIFTSGLSGSGKTIFILLILSLLLSIHKGCNVSTEVDPFKAAVAMIEITPPVGFPQQQGTSTGVKSPLYAKTLVIRQGNVHGAILMCDLALIPKDLSSIVHEQASEHTGIPFQNITISVAHTHASLGITEEFKKSADRKA